MRRLLIVLAALAAGVIAFNYLAPGPAGRIALALERARCGLSAKRATIPGFEIAYLEGGEGEPLLLIHGFGADKDNFTRVSAYLTDQYHVIIPDLPGFGESSKPLNATYTIGEQVERVHAFARQLGITRTHMGGNSMGGFISVAYAAKYPDEIASLWLLAPAGTAGFEGEVLRVVRETGENPLLTRDPGAFRQKMDYALSRKPWIPYSVERLFAERAAADYALHKRIFGQIGGPVLESYITRLDIPALVVWGKDDRVLSPAATRIFKTFMPDMQLILMDGIGHLPMFEAPASTARDYLRFRHALGAVGRSPTAP